MDFNFLHTTKAKAATNRFVALISLLAALCFPIAVTAEARGDRDKVEGTPAAIIGKPSAGDTRGEQGLLEAMALMYASTRNAVRDAYDEVMYWQGLEKSFNKIDKWLSDNQREYGDSKIANRQISMKKEHLWNRLIKMESMFDGMDSSIFYEARKFDRALSAIKDKRDSVTFKLNDNIRNADISTYYRVERRPYSAVDTSTNTTIEALDSVIGKIDEFYLTTSVVDKKLKNPDITYAVKQKIKATRDSVPDAQLFDMTKMQIASSMARSEYYYAWSLNAMENMDSLDDRFARYKSISQIDAQTAWYHLEAATAKNVKIRHSIEELKLYIANLGLDVNRNTQVRADALFGKKLITAIRDTIISRQAPHGGPP